MTKHLEYKVSYWTTLPQYKQQAGCVTRRYSDFEWLWKMLRSSMDGVIVPALPHKTLMVGRCRLTLSKPVLKAHMASALEATI